MRDGLCQAMRPKMKTRTKPALTERANSGLRPPMVDGIIMIARIQNCLQKPEERQEGGGEGGWR